MADDKSFSDWESVGNDASVNQVALANGVREDDDDDDDDAKKSQPENNNQAHKVIVELPPGGLALGDIPSAEGAAYALPADTSDKSSITSSFVKNLGGLKLDRGAGSSASSSMSSYVPVFHPNVALSSMARYRWKSQQPSSNDSRSSWSHIDPSVASASQNYSYCGSSVSGNTVGSLASNFDIISLSSGATILQCKRCKFHNPATSRICESCSLALVANPNTDMDEQIARHLQQQEEQDARLRLQEQERKRGRLADQSLLEQARLLTVELEGLFKPYRRGRGAILSGPHRETVFLPLPEHDLRHHAAQFISVATAMANVELNRTRLMYKVVRTEGRGCNPAKVWNAIRSRGFAQDASVGFDEPVTVGTTLEGAWAQVRTHATGSDIGNSYVDMVMPSIPEHDGEHEIEPSPYLAWIVAVVGAGHEKRNQGPLWSFLTPTSGSGPTTRFDLSEQVLPLICFDPVRYGNSDEIRILMNGLSRIFWDFFGTSGLDLKSQDLLSPSVPQPASRKKSKGADGKPKPTKPNKFQLMKESRMQQQCEEVHRALNSGESALLAVETGEEVPKGDLHELVQKEMQYAAVEAGASRRARKAGALRCALGNLQKMCDELEAEKSALELRSSNNENAALSQLPMQDDGNQDFGSLEGIFRSENMTSLLVAETDPALFSHNKNEPRSHPRGLRLHVSHRESESSSGLLVHENATVDEGLGFLPQFNSYGNNLVSQTMVGIQRGVPLEDLDPIGVPLEATKHMRLDEIAKVHLATMGVDICRKMGGVTAAPTGDKMDLQRSGNRADVVDTFANELMQEDMMSVGTQE